MQYLFERLANNQQDPQYTPSKEELQLNVLRQIQCIVASRPWLEGDHDGRHLLSFGLPAVPELAPGNGVQLRCYGERLKRMIADYEPRLENPSVEVQGSANPAAPVRVMVAGQLQVEDEVLPVLLTSETRID
ncbi:type VI secretion system baseplate subunit TssE [bacterium]|nr:MAG: type VI secretion system baseplate subunit TssE [bacterium]